MVHYTVNGTFFYTEFENSQRLKIKNFAHVCTQCAGAGFNLQHFYHQGDPVFQVWNCHKNHPQCLVSSPTVTPPMLIFQKLESTK